jgi:hypothetical protein
LEQRVVGPGGTEDFSRLTSAVFVRKTAEAAVHFTGRRTGVDIYATDYRRSYFDATLGNEHERRGSVDFTRELSRQSRIGFGGRIGQTDLNTGETFREANYHVDFTRNYGERVVVGLTAYRTVRTGALDFTVHVVTASLTGRF